MPVLSNCQKIIGAGGVHLSKQIGTAQKLHTSKSICFLKALRLSFPKNLKRDP